jgi:aspartyl-tRNA(Asn)/glutamyl-tRNA(Gln) amidotransferase subunit A
MEVLSRPDARDWTSLPAQEVLWSDLACDVRQLRVGLHLEAGCGEPVEPEIITAVTAVADVFQEAGACVDPVAPFMSQELIDDLNLFWKVRSWRDFHALPADRKRRVLPYIVDWCHEGADVSGAKLLECYQHITEIQSRAVAATTGFDVVLSPVAPVAAFPAEQPMPFMQAGKGMSHIGFTAPYNMSGQPAATVNCGFTGDGRTIGVQISGRRFDDIGVLRAAAWYEARRPDTARPLWPDRARQGTAVTDGVASGTPEGKSGA